MINAKEGNIELEGDLLELSADISTTVYAIMNVVNTRKDVFKTLESKQEYVENVYDNVLYAVKCAKEEIEKKFKPKRLKNDDTDFYKNFNSSMEE